MLLFTCTTGKKGVGQKYECLHVKNTHQFHLNICV